ncbi:hypothetical protein AV530_000560 [Patagioenas fasciata monilis]|uniref:Uncharacterized protein n=1 Tax=Patagioenas fasciata monilis TaxID=372326 RepID=A0A1V4IFP1_PATFA|nr:hypothetical protein AV530_000560 [Patagioenas fasciata monilis]
MTSHSFASPSSADQQVTRRGGRGSCDVPDGIDGCEEPRTHALPAAGVCCAPHRSAIYSLRQCCLNFTATVAILDGTSSTQIIPFLNEDSPTVHLDFPPAVLAFCKLLPRKPSCIFMKPATCEGNAFLHFQNDK